MNPQKRSVWERIPKWISITMFSACLVFVWQLIVWAEVTSVFALPPPWDVALATRDIVGDMVAGGPTLNSFWITAQESVYGFVVAAVIGIGFAILIAESAFGRVVVMPFLVAINAAPKVAFAPIFVAWFGFGISAKVALAAFIAFFPLLIDTAAGLAGVDAEREKLFQAMRMSRYRTFVKLRLPSALPFIFAGLKTASILAVVGAVVGEFLGGGSGFGELIKISGSRLAIDRVFAFVLILSIAGYAFYAVIAWLEKVVVFWRRPDGHALAPTA